MYYCFDQKNREIPLTVCNVPFRVSHRDGKVAPIDTHNVVFDAGEAGGKQGCFSRLWFLGMSTDSWQCSEWWAQTEVQYDASIRLFFGDRVGRIRILFEDRTEELISVIFGVNAFNYNLYFGQKPNENLFGCFAAPYDEPFRSDPNAKKLLNDALVMTENASPDAEKMTKWVFAYAPRADKRIKLIEWFKEEGKRADFVISGITGLYTGEPDNTGLPTVDRFFFLRKDWYAPIERLSRRLYQYRDQIPQSVEEVPVSGFDAPALRFYNNDGLDLFTNVYRVNVMDMAYRKVTNDGMTHTSSENAPNFGCYIGFGSFNQNESYSSQIWTRDIGRLLIELADLGYFDRVRMAIDRLHEMLYYPSIRFKIPHWKRIANLIAKDESELFNEGNENDGHASIMMAIYNLYRKGGVDLGWLRENERHLRAAADYYLWQEAHPVESNFEEILFSHSETSSQTYGGYDLYGNMISLYALRQYAKLFDLLGDGAYANNLRRLADRIYAGLEKRFLMHHPAYGEVWTDTTDDCWTYEYKRFAALLFSSDCETLDAAFNLPALFERMNRTFLAEKELYYNPYSGRQMGYGQGYLTSTTLLLDRTEAYTDCVNASANLCYHHTDHPYIVPEGVICHGSGRFWYRNSDLGNAVQQAEIVKLARLMTGIDDLDGTRFRLIPRLPLTMTAIEAEKVPVTVGRTVNHISFRYARDKNGTWFAEDAKTAYSLTYDGTVLPEWVRVGPFESREIHTNATLLRTSQINGGYYAYLSVGK